MARNQAGAGHGAGPKRRVSSHRRVARPGRKSDRKEKTQRSTGRFAVKCRVEYPMGVCPKPNQTCKGPTERDPFLGVSAVGANKLYLEKRVLAVSEYQMRTLSLPRGCLMETVIPKSTPCPVGPGRNRGQHQKETKRKRCYSRLNTRGAFHNAFALIKARQRHRGARCLLEPRKVVLTKKRSCHMHQSG